MSMDVAITAIFSTLQSARSAADCLSICPGGAQTQEIAGQAPAASGERLQVSGERLQVSGERLQVSLEHCDHGAVTAAGRMLGGMLDVTPTGSAAAGREQSALVRVRCSEQLSAFAARELAALGAEKITITPLS